MADEDLPFELRRAGGDYLDALRSLGLEPEGLAWARVHVPVEGPIESWRLGDWHLVLVTSFVDEAGPLALNEVLFKAFAASATPQSVSPFIVDVVSTKASIAREIMSAMTSDPIFSATIRTADGTTSTVTGEGGMTQIAGLWFRRMWVYATSAPAKSFKQRRESWLHFKQQVNARAA